MIQSIRCISLALLALLVPRIAGACPSAPAQEKITKDALARWKVDTATTPVDYVRFLGSGESCLVVVSLSVERFSHVDGASLGILELILRDRRWKLAFEQKDVLQAGMYGHAPQPQIIYLGRRNTLALRLDFEDMRSGNVSRGFVLAAKVDGNYKRIFTLTEHYDNSGTGEYEATERNAEFSILHDDQEFPDIEVTYSSTESGTEDKSVPGVSTEIYSFVKGEYEIVQKENPKAASR
jgi:hypothetical protein